MQTKIFFDAYAEYNKMLDIDDDLVELIEYIEVGCAMIDVKLRHYTGKSNECCHLDFMSNNSVDFYLYYNKSDKIILKHLEKDRISIKSYEFENIRTAVIALKEFVHNWYT